MTTFFFRRSVEKAFQLDDSPSDLSLNLNVPLQSNPPHITSVVDDVMYIVSKVLQRSLATCQRSVIAGVVPTVARVLGSDFVGMIQRKMRDENFPRAVVPGGQPPEDKVIAFLVLINNLDISTDYVKRIVNSRVDTSGNAVALHEGDSPAVALSDSFPFGNDASFVRETLLSLQHSFEQKTTELAGDGLQVTFSQVIKPRIRPIIADAFRDVDYLSTEEDRAERARFRDDEIGDATDEEYVKTQFTHGWDNLMKPVKRILSDRNYDKLLTLTVNYLSSKVLEKRIWAYQGRVNELGAVRLERDIAGIASAVVRGGRYGLRNAFSRCIQICLVMNMEEDEWEEAKGGERDGESSIVWVLDPDERNRARSMIRN